MVWYLTEEGVLCNLGQMTHIMAAKTDFKDQSEGSKAWQVVAMFPTPNVGSGHMPQMHIPLMQCDTKEECHDEITKLQDLFKTSLH